MTRQWPDVRAWLQTNTPTGRGMCLNTSMRAYDADPIGVADATEAIGKTKDLHTGHTTDIPAGAHVLYSGGSNGHGHSCVADGDGYVWTVDWYSGLNITRVAQADMEAAWGNLRWAGWSAYYGTQPLHLGDEPDPEPTPPPEDDDVPDYLNAAGKDVTLADGSDWQTVEWSDAWGTDVRTDDHKGFKLPAGALYTVDYSVRFDPAASANLLARVAFYGPEGWWHGAEKELVATSATTPTGYTYNGKFDHDGTSWKIQLKPNGGGKITVTDQGVRGLYWKP